MKKMGKQKHYCYTTDRDVTISVEYEKVNSLGGFKELVGPSFPTCIYDQECWNNGVKCKYNGLGGKDAPDPFVKH